MMSSLYSILNIDQNANQEQIKQAAQVQIKKVKLAVQKRHYRFFKLQEGVSDEKVKIAAQLRIQRIKKAYSILSNPEARQEYDKKSSREIVTKPTVKKEIHQPSIQNPAPKIKQEKEFNPLTLIWESTAFGAGWFFGFLLGMSGISLFFDGHFMIAFAFLVSSFLLLPPSQNWFYNQLGKHIYSFLTKNIKSFINKEKVRISWFFSFIFLFIGVMSFINISVIYGVMIITAGLLTLPPIQNWFDKTLNISFSNFSPGVQLNTIVILPLMFIVAPIGIMLSNFEQYRHDMAIEQQQKEQFAKFENELKQALKEVHTAFDNEEYEKVKQITAKYTHANDEEINTYHEEAKKRLFEQEMAKKTVRDREIYYLEQSQKAEINRRTSAYSRPISGQDMFGLVKEDYNSWNLGSTVWYKLGRFENEHAIAILINTKSLQKLCSDCSIPNTEKAGIFVRHFKSDNGMSGVSLLGNVLKATKMAANREESFALIEVNPFHGVTFSDFKRICQAVGFKVFSQQEKGKYASMCFYSYEEYLNALIAKTKQEIAEREEERKKRLTELQLSISHKLYSKTSFKIEGGSNLPTGTRMTINIYKGANITKPYRTDDVVVQNRGIFSSKLFKVEERGKYIAVLETDYRIYYLTHPTRKNFLEEYRSDDIVNGDISKSYTFSTIPPKEEQVVQPITKPKKLEISLSHESIDGKMYIKGKCNLPKDTKLGVTLLRKHSTSDYRAQDFDIFVDENGEFISTGFTSHNHPILSGDYKAELTSTFNKIWHTESNLARLKLYYGDEIKDGTRWKQILVNYNFSHVVSQAANTSIKPKQYIQLVKNFCYALQASGTCNNLQMRMDTENKIV